MLRIPDWFPPEGIVGIGHLSAIIGAIGMAVSTVHWWGGIVAAIGIAGNHVADCIDGTHARRTGQCRNGGELLDHFTDPLSFAYYLIGIGVAIERLDLALVAVVCLFAMAVLTNIKAKLVGEFTLPAFGPTEFKTLLCVCGIALSFAFFPGLPLVNPTTLLHWFYLALIAVGLICLPLQLVSSVAEVNRFGARPDTSEWELNSRASETTSVTSPG
jgi:phosphatidylglycerophosphate synthase